MEKEVPRGLSWREKVTRTSLAFSAAWTMSFPPHLSEEACERAIAESHIELQEAPLLGFTFRSAEAAFVGLEPKSAMEELLQMGFDQVRISMYPNQSTEKMVEEITWQVALAEKYNTDIILVLGRKAPGWPEEYLPRDAHQETIDKTKAVLTAVGDHDSVKIIQVSNEPFIANGELQPEDPSLLNEMKTLIAHYEKPMLFTDFIDPKRVYSDGFGDVLGYGDVGGADVYLETSGGRGSCIGYTGRLTHIDTMAKVAGKPLMVTELQTLPWPDQINLRLPLGHHLIVPLPLQKNMEPADIRKLYKMVLMNTDAESIHFWEMARILAAEHRGDHSRMNEIRRIINQNQETREQLIYQKQEAVSGIISFSVDHK